ncbi:MAG: acyltransferase [Acidobacteriota bacterium]|nr:acyltransferase [Acidobacteriota bacterium]
MRILQIQGLRALAALLVTIFHARLVPGGFIGVDIFYVISGYLITGLILREIENTGKLDLNAFYQRRIKRLLPTSVFVLFSTAIVGMFVLPAITRDALGRDLFAAAAYISNYLFAWWQNDYQNLNATPSPFIHYWSLAVEEQFYVVWPIFLLLLSRYGKRAIFWGIAGTTAASLVLSVYQTQTSPIWAFYSLPTRAWELGVGALLLFIPDNIWRNRYIPWLGVIGILIATFNFDENTAFPGINAVLPVVATALLIGSISIWPRLFNDLSNNRVSQWLGAISYPLYLWHWPALVLPSSALGRPLRIRERVLCIVLTVVLAHLTSKFVEQPIRHKKIAGKKVYLFFVATTITSLVAGLIISASASSLITVKGTNYKFNLTKVMEKPAVYGDNCHVNYGETKSGYCTYGVKSSKKVIVLYGDSHAAQWFPALEKIALEKGYKLISLTKSACPSVDSPREDQGAFKNVHCEKWRKNSIARIQSVKPDAVIVSSFQYFTPPSGFASRAKWWSDGQKRLLNDLKGSSSRLIYISDTPRPLRDIPNCLASRDSHSCDSTEKTPNVIIDGFIKIDPTSWLCTSFCPAIKDGYVAYRDASHISVAAALALKPELEKALGTTGLFS